MILFKPSTYLSTFLFKPHTHLSELSEGNYRLNILLLLPQEFEAYLEEDTSSLIFTSNIANRNNRDFTLTISKSNQAAPRDNGTTNIPMEVLGTSYIFPMQLPGTSFPSPVPFGGTTLFSITREIELDANAEINVSVNIKKETFNLLSDQNLKAIFSRASTRDSLKLFKETEIFINYCKDHTRTDANLIPRIPGKSKELIDKLEENIALLEVAIYTDTEYKDELIQVSVELKQNLEEISAIANGNFPRSTTDDNNDNLSEAEKLLRAMENYLNLYKEKKTDHRVAKIKRDTRGADSTEKEE